MSTQEFESAEGLDDAFDAVMEREEDKEHLRQEIKDLNYEIESMRQEVGDKERELDDLINF